jgi:hypothetical protein
MVTPVNLEVPMDVETASSTSSKVLSITGRTFGVLLIAGLACLKGMSALRPQQSAAAQEAIQNINRESTKYQGKARQEFERDGQISEATRMAAFRSMDEQLARDGAADSEVAPVIRGHRKWLHLANEKMETVTRLSAEVDNTKGYADLSFTSREQVEALIALAKSSEEAAIENLNLWRGAASTIRTILDQEGATSAMVSSYVKGSTLSHPLVIRIRELDVLQAGLVREQIEILHDQWGHWQPSNDGIIFENEAALARFNKTVDDIQATSDESTRLTRTLLTKN